MNGNNENIGLARQLVTSVRIVIFTMAVCCVLYTLLIFVIGRTLTPHTAEGSLITYREGKVMGSELIAQKFTRPEYFWPRPSAVDFNAAATGGSNLSPTNPKLRERALEIMGVIGTTADNPIPADLVTASGSGLDPHITLEAARYQAERVAEARGLPIETVNGILDEHAVKTGGMLTPEPLVNVLLINIELDRTVE
ncbi:MAG: potassium-transporting ATPase subunit KdpC [Candidatus Dadabacteria bacterium]|nr:potassium-transporting ATPase subunit KdpC [Candidatus Dadabacteria bacterium]